MSSRRRRDLNLRLQLSLAAFLYASLLLIKIRKKYKKEEHKFISIEEFCTYTGLKLDQVQAFF